jgi:hypothetical protein
MLSNSQNPTVFGDNFCFQHINSLYYYYYGKNYLYIYVLYRKELSTNET